MVLPKSSGTQAVHQEALVLGDGRSCNELPNQAGQRRLEAGCVKAEVIGDGQLSARTGNSNEQISHSHQTSGRQIRCERWQRARNAGNYILHDRSRLPSGFDGRWCSGSLPGNANQPGRKTRPCGRSVLEVLGSVGFRGGGVVFWLTCTRWLFESDTMTRFVLETAM